MLTSLLASCVMQRTDWATKAAHMMEHHPSKSILSSAAWFGSSFEKSGPPSNRNFLPTLMSAISPLMRSHKRTTVLRIEHKPNKYLQSRMLR